ncbi:MAG: PASTA domain-containing protein [Actinomycetota bacterium]
MRRDRMVTLVLLLAIALTASACQNRSTTPAKPKPVTPSGPGSILFERQDLGDNFNVYAVDPEGTQEFRLTHESSDDTLAFPSPDGELIAYSSNPDGGATFDIFVMNADGSNVRRLTQDATTEDSPVWSPDAARIAFSSDRSGGGDVYVMNADGSGVTKLTQDPGQEYPWSWSSDGSKILYTVFENENSDIYVMNADGSDVQQLSSDPGGEYGPVWSPDGTRIAFSSNRGGNSDVFVMNADGSGVTNITAHSADDSGPVWSPDGTRIAFSSSRTGTFDVYVMNTDGSGVAQVTDTIDPEFASGWSSKAVTSPAPPPVGTEEEVPDLVGQFLGQAKTLADSAGLKVQVSERRLSEEAAFIILSQSPTSGASLEPGGAIQVVISNGKIRIPNVTGKKVSAAKRILKAHDISYSIEEDYASSGFNRVASQKPHAGLASSTSTVIIRVKVRARPGDPCTPGENLPGNLICSVGGI